MSRVGNVKIYMKCVHTFGTGRHKREADITLLFQYITFRERGTGIIAPGKILNLYTSFGTVSI